MDRFRELATFVAVAEEGAFNAAARRLHSSPSAVTRLINGLEARLDLRLFTRTTRRVALTEAGERLRVDATRILAELAEAEASAAGAHAAPRGDLRVTAPVLFGQRFVAPILRDYLEAHPAVTSSTLFVDRVVDMIDEGLDVAVRIGELADSTLTATRVGAVRRVVVAAPAYLDTAPALQTPADLAEHRVVIPIGLGAAPSWDFAATGARQQVRLHPRLRVNTVAPAIDAAFAGWGLTRVLSYQVTDALADGSLVEVLGDFEDRRLPIHLLHSEGRRAAAKIRTFVDLAAARLREERDRLLALPA